jgi:hypothetical protein
MKYIICWEIFQNYDSFAYYTLTFLSRLSKHAYGLGFKRLNSGQKHILSHCRILFGEHGNQKVATI